MESAGLLRVEIITMFLSISYIVYFSLEKAYFTYKKLHMMVKPVLSSETSTSWENSEEIVEKNKQSKPLKVTKDDSKIDVNSYTKDKNLSEEDKNKLIEIIKKVKLNSSKGYYETAKSLIIEGLAIDKYNTELNLELAHIYEEEKNYKNAEYIYNDLMHVQKSNMDILKRLWYILAVQRRFKEAIVMYEKVYKKNTTDLETVELLIDLHYEVGNYDKALEHVIVFLKEKPRNIERMALKAELLKKGWKDDDTKEVYRKILEIQPYNTEALEYIKENK